MKQYEEHQERKAKARALINEIVRKIKEEEEGFEKATFINFDLQRVLETPKGPGGPIFYKRKLACYNLTLYNMNSHAGFCNIWCETDGQRGANDVALIVFDAVSNDKDHSDFYFVSDSCGGQNRNQFFSGMCLYGQSAPYIMSDRLLTSIWKRGPQNKRGIVCTVPLNELPGIPL